MEYKSVRVRTPYGMRLAELRSQTHNGYRTGRIWINGKKVRGRVEARHGFEDGRILKFEVLSNDAHRFYTDRTFLEEV